MKLSDISVDYIGHYGSDDVVVNAARVSFDKEASEYTLEQNAKLLKYLATHKHFSPFNHTFISLRIKAPIFVARQLVKHRFMPWNEVSRRYVDDEPEFYMPAFRARADNVKQGSSEEIIKKVWWPSSDNWYSPEERLEEHLEMSLSIYRGLLKANVAPEVARAVLPQNMMTQWYWSGTLGAYCDMLRLRLDPHTQAESRIVAQKIREIIEPLFPVSVPALLEIK